MVGFYEIRRSGDRNEMVAVNADRREANLALLPQETLDLWQTRDEGAQAAAAAGDTEQVRNRWRLGWFFLLLAFLVVLAESLLGAKYLSIDRGAA
jgi:Flp pilus assembly protein TadB